MKKLVSLALCVATLVAAPAEAATLVVNSSGKLTGATGVMVGDKSYDVTFASGTCAAVFGVCESGNFDFNSQSSAKLAVAALASQVFVDDALGKFDSKPTLTAGCENVETCSVRVLYGLAGASRVYFAGYVNGPLATQDKSGVGIMFTSDSNPMLARFTASAVPEPATWALMLFGFGVICAAMRRRGQVVAVRFA